MTPDDEVKLREIVALLMKALAGIAAMADLTRIAIEGWEERKEEDDNGRRD